MPRTKRRKVETNLTAVNATLGNQSKTVKDILYEFDCESNIEHEYL